MVRNVGHRTEGSVLNYAANTFNAIPDYMFLKGNQYDRILAGTGAVLVYRVASDGTISASTSYDFDADMEPVPGPGSGATPVEESPNAYNQTSGRDIAFLPESAGGTVGPTLFVQGGTTTDKVRLGVTAGAITFTTLGSREKADRGGSERFRVGYSVINPDVLVLGSNDGGFPSHGIHATCGSDLVNFYDPDADGIDGRFTTGIYFDQDGQWPVLTEGYEGMQFAIGTLDNKYRVHLLDPGDPCGVPQVEPNVVHTWRIKTPSDRFTKNQRWYIGGSVNDAYDADIGRDMLYMSGSNTPQGIVAIDRNELEEWLFDEMGQTGTGNPSSDLLDMNTAPTEVVVGRLNTDPELSNVPNILETERFLQTLYFDSNPSTTFNIAGRLLTFAPRMAIVPSVLDGPADTWVLAAPCGFLDNGQEELDAGGNQFADYEDNPGWTAEPAVSDMTRLFLQFWDVSDPDTFDGPVEWMDFGVPSNAALIGDFDFASAVSLKVETWGTRTYIFVADYGGRVLVYDMTDVLYDNTNPIKLIETWTPNQSLTDNLPNAVWDVVVDRAQWLSGTTSITQLYVYAAVERLGIEVLRFDPECPPGERLKKVELIQTPGNVRSMVIRGTGSNRSLILSDSEAGLRVLEYNF
jgi:hypothetical protein